MFSEKIAVIFPGMGYNTDKPLLYYTKKLAKAADYDVIDVTYELPVKSKDILNDKEGMKATFEIAAKQVEKQLVFTPVPQTFDFLRAESGIVFHGNADPWCRTDIVKTRCKELGLEMIIVEKGNHSLETGEVIRDVQELRNIMKIVEMRI